MEDLIIDIVYNLLKDKNLYNYNNENQLKDTEITEITNLLNEKVINIKIGEEYYRISCNKIYVGEPM